MQQRDEPETVPEGHMSVPPPNAMLEMPFFMSPAPHLKCFRQLFPNPSLSRGKGGQGQGDWVIGSEVLMYFRESDLFFFLKFRVMLHALVSINVCFLY